MFFHHTYQWISLVVDVDVYVDVDKYVDVNVGRPFLECTIAAQASRGCSLAAGFISKHKCTTALTKELR